MSILIIGKFFKKMRQISLLQNKAKTIITRYNFWNYKVRKFFLPKETAFITKPDIITQAHYNK